MSKEKFNFAKHIDAALTVDMVSNELLTRGFEKSTEDLRSGNAGLRHEKITFRDKHGKGVLSIDINTNVKPCTITFEYGTSKDKKIFSAIGNNFSLYHKGTRTKDIEKS